MIELSIPVSPEQEDAIADHILEGKPLGMVPDERVWMVKHAKKAHPDHKVVSADLNISDVKWTLVLEPV